MGLNLKKDKIMGTKRWLYWVSIGTILIIIYKFFDNFTGIGNWIKNLFGVLGPFLVAILIAYILYKPTSQIERVLKSKKIKHSRGISIFIVYVLVIIIIALILKFIIPAIFNSIVDLVNNLQNYYNSVSTDDIQPKWSTFIKSNIIRPLVEYVQQINFKEMFTPERIQNYLTSAIGIAKSVVSGFIAVISSIYILSEREKIVGYIKKFAKASMTRNGYFKFNRYFTNGNRIFFGFISSQFIDAIVVTIMMSIIMLILHVKYAILLGVLIGLFNLIPYFGAIIAVIIAGLLTVLTGGWKKALVMVIITIIVQQIDANVINPRITGNALHVSPLLVVFSVTVGGAYFGVIGMFLAVPIAVLIKLMIDDFILAKEKDEREDV